MRLRSLADAGAAVDIEIVGAFLPAAPVFLNENRQASSLIARSVQNAVNQPRPQPESLPAQSAVALVVYSGGFELFAVNLDFGAIEKDFRLPRVKSSLGLGLFDRTVNKISIDPAQRHHTLRGLSPQPLAESCLIGSLLKAQKSHQNFVLAATLGIGKTGAANCQHKHKLGNNGDWREPDALAFSWVQRGFILNALPEIKAAAEGVDKDLTAMSSGLIGMGQLDVELGVSLGEERHDNISSYR
jgi:hypothetical protein